MAHMQFSPFQLIIFRVIIQYDTTETRRKSSTYQLFWFDHFSPKILAKKAKRDVGKLFIRFT